jgi:hypothetical protein
MRFGIIIISQEGSYHSSVEFKDSGKSRIYINVFQVMNPCSLVSGETTFWKSTVRVEYKGRWSLHL